MGRWAFQQEIIQNKLNPPSSDKLRAELKTEPKL